MSVKKKYVPEGWRPDTWNDVISVILEIIRTGKVDWKKLKMDVMSVDDSDLYPGEKNRYLIYESSQPTFTDLGSLVEEYKPAVIFVTREVADNLFASWEPEENPVYFFRGIPTVLWRKK